MALWNIVPTWFEIEDRMTQDMGHQGRHGRAPRLSVSTDTANRLGLPGILDNSQIIEQTPKSPLTHFQSMPGNHQTTVPVTPRKPMPPRIERNAKTDQHQHQQHPRKGTHPQLVAHHPTQ